MNTTESPAQAVVVLYLIAIIGVYASAMLTIFVQKAIIINRRLAERDSWERQRHEQEEKFIKASTGVGMSPTRFSDLTTLLMCDFIPGIGRRAVKTVEQIYVSAKEFADFYDVTIVDVSPGGAYNTRSGMVMYSTATVHHSVMRKKF